MKKKINQQAIQIAGYLHEWLEYYVPSIKACSPHTKRNYKTSMTLYVEFLRKMKGILPKALNVECFRREYIMEWIIWMKSNRDCAPATCNVRLSALRAFLRYVADRDMTYMAVFLQAENIPNEKTPKRKVIGLSKKAVKALLSVPNQRTVTGFRDFTLMLLLYSTAVRINELLTLKICNIVIDCTKPHLIVIGKGRKKRPLPLLSKPVQCLKKYFKKYHPKHNDMDALIFYSKIYPKGPENGRTVQMNCESVGSDFQAIWQKILKRQVYANFGQSSVTKTLPSPLKARIGKSGNE